MEENKLEENTENKNIKDDTGENIDKIEENKTTENEDKIKENVDLEENDDGINKEDIDNIVNYLTNLDFEKYSRDMEIKEALMVLKTKMDKEQEIKEKEKQIENEKVIIINDNKINSNIIINYFITQIKFHFKIHLYSLYNI